MVAELALGITAVTGAALGIVLYKNASQSSFLYANARIISRAVLDHDACLKLAECDSLPELVAKLNNTDSQEFLRTINKKSLLEFSMAVEQGFIQSIQNTKNLSPKKFQPVFDAYDKIYEGRILKTFFRSRFSNTHLDKSLVEPIGSINPVLLTRLHQTKTLADVQLVLHNTEYEKIFDQKISSIEEFDLALEETVMKGIDESLSGLRVADRDHIAGIFAKRKLIKNILMLLKCKIRKQKEIQKKVQLDSPLKEKAINAKTMEEFVNAFESTELEQPLQNALAKYNKTDNFYSFEQELHRWFLTSVSKEDLSHPIGPYPLVSYLTKKRMEFRNLLIIAKGITAQLDKKELKEMVI
ncbi:hypothetical protein GOV09_03705 [Candidatus Woesearchaeota archaeon]|nr:hypothetical protein [Candidatus Woesearchaeota archaeon]